MLLLIPLFALTGSSDDAGFRAAAAVLSQNCVRCHNADKSRGGLDLSSRETALAGGATHDAIVPGDLETSFLLTRARDGTMPPPKDGRRLSGDEVESLAQWIKQGAAWPESITLPLAAGPRVVIQPRSVSSPPHTSRWRLFWRRR
jgi:mono/diheme cytochrome c family protein